MLAKSDWLAEAAGIFPTVSIPMDQRAEVVEIKMPKVTTSFAELQTLLRTGCQDALGRAIA